MVGLNIHADGATPVDDDTTTYNNIDFSSLIHQADVISLQVRPRKGYWQAFNIRSEDALEKFDAARRLFVSDMDFTLKLLELSTELARKADLDRNDLRRQQERVQVQLAQSKEELKLFKSMSEQNAVFNNAIATLKESANTFVDKTAAQTEQINALSARNAELEEEVKALKDAAKKL